MSKQRYAVVVLEVDPTYKTAPVVVDTLGTFRYAATANRYEADLYGTVVPALKAKNPNLRVAVVEA